ncbi:MAG: transcription antitermination factor NusB [Pseudomonadota bacterium]|nr:transcription antitermination factor NusB [Pseudomonadota bacterium]
MMKTVERKRERLNGSARRSAARLAAVQALYQIDQSSALPDSVVDEFLRFRLGESFDTENDVAPHKNLFCEIVLGVAARGGQIDDVAGAALSNKWTFERLELILKAILRAGIYELESRPDTPMRVIVSEYVDVAHAFYDGQEPGMVNGMLDRVARTLRADEFGDGSRDE